MDRWMHDFNEVWVYIFLLYKLILCRKIFGNVNIIEKTNEIPKKFSRRLDMIKARNSVYS